MAEGAAEHKQEVSSFNLNSKFTGLPIIPKQQAFSKLSLHQRHCVFGWEQGVGVEWGLLVRHIDVPFDNTLVS